MMQTEGKAPAPTWPKDGRVTGFANPKCYAQCLGDCDDEITAEHYISKNILDRHGDNFLISGMHWQAPGESKVLTSSTLLSRILCKRHNNALSDLDNRIGALFDVLRQLKTPMARRDEHRLKELRIHKAFWGQDLERWMLKTYLGNIFSGNSVYLGQKIPRGTPIPDDQVRALFCPEPWPADWGLYLVAVLGEKWRTLDGVALAFQWDEQAKRLKSFRIEMMGFPFIVYLESPPADIADKILQRPRQIELRLGATTKSIRFQWQGSQDGEQREQAG